MSVAQVTARIEQIQARFNPVAMSPATATAFADQLQQTAAPQSPSPASSSSPSFAAPASSQGATGADVVADAKQYLGVPYVWGGDNPQSGLDCSGLVQRVYSDLGYDLPRVSYQQADAGRPVASLDKAQPGDILAFHSPVSHVAIYLGNGKMIEAPRPGLSVRITDVYATPTAIRRILPDNQAPSFLRATNDLHGLSTSLDRARLGLGQYLDASQITNLVADGVLR